MKYIKYFETFEEYEEWINIEENAREVYKTEEKICVGGIILSHTNKPYTEKEDKEWFMNGWKKTEKTLTF